MDEQGQGTGKGGPPAQEESLVLAISFEPPGALRERVFGLDDAALRRVVALALEHAAIAEPVEVSLLLTTDAGIRALNRDYRGRDEATDVLSFPLLDEPLVDAPEDQLWQPAEHAGPVVALDLDLDSAVDAEYTTDLRDGEWDDEDGADGVGEDAEPELLPLEELALPLGDIAISRDAVERQAAQAGHSTTWELAYLLAHGVLHLVGYDDQTDAGYQAMVAHQEAVLARAGIQR
jgi:probable rRNA maturation factor